MENIDIIGGESVYCINENQLHRAYELVMTSDDKAFRLKAHLAILENDLDRNELAALAFVMIDRLLKSH